MRISISASHEGAASERPGKAQTAHDPGITVTGYGYWDLGGPMELYAAREVARMRRWREASDPGAGLRNDDLAILKREQAERRRRMEKGEIEGPPNPYKPHRKR